MNMTPDTPPTLSQLDKNESSFEGANEITEHCTDPKDALDQYLSHNDSTAKDQNVFKSETHEVPGQSIETIVPA